MRVSVKNLYSDTTKTIEGEPRHVEAELTRCYPWLNSEKPEDRGNVEELIELLDATQAFEARVEDRGQDPVHVHEPLTTQLVKGRDDEVAAAMLGHDEQLARALDAAKFLAGGKAADPQRVREALREADGDPEEAALASYGLEPSEANRRALRSVQDLSKADPAVRPASMKVEAGHPDAKDTAREVERAFHDQYVVPVQLGGRHSRGSLLARDEETGTTWLLKPDSGGMSPAKGINEEQAPMARRDAAFWHVADAWGLGRCIPHTDLLLLDGRDYAAIQLLPWAYKPVQDIMKTQAPTVRATFDRMLREGTLHRLGALFAVLGETDAHSGNEMTHDGDVQFIDHGGAWAGPDFDPAHDKDTFTPFFLRYNAVGKWREKTAAERLAAMPRVGRQAADELRAWIEDIDEEGLRRIADSYGIDPGPALGRLARLKSDVRDLPADLAVNRFWVEV